MGDVERGERGGRREGGLDLSHPSRSEATALWVALSALRTVFGGRPPRAAVAALLGPGLEWVRPLAWKRAELLAGAPRGGVMQEQGLVNPGEALEDGGVGGEVLTHFDEGAGGLSA